MHEKGPETDIKTKHEARSLSLQVLGFPRVAAFFTTLHHLLAPMASVKQVQNLTKTSSTCSHSTNMRNTSAALLTVPGRPFKTLVAMLKQVGPEILSIAGTS